MSKLIEKLTKDQEDKIPQYYKEYLDIGLSTEPCDRQRAEAALTKCYEYLKLTKPTFLWCDSPRQGAIEAAKLATKKAQPTHDEIREQVGKASYGSFEAYWVSFYAYIAEVLPVSKDELIDIVKEIVKNCGVYWTLDNIIVISEKPIEIHMKDGKLHNPNGLAIKYKDGTGVFCVNGQRYPSLLDMRIAAAASDSV